MNDTQFVETRVEPANRNQIPEAERCGRCDGWGVINFRATGQKGYTPILCCKCGGDGKERENVAEA